jgi:hypothetical protein
MDAGVIAGNAIAATLDAPAPVADRVERIDWARATTTVCTRISTASTSSHCS